MPGALSRLMKDLVTPREEPIRVNPDSHPLNVALAMAVGAHFLGQSRTEKAILVAQPFVISAAATYGAHQGVKKRP